MTRTEAKDILRRFNAWRRDNEGKCEPVSPTDIGIAIDTLTEGEPKDLQRLANGLTHTLGIAESVDMVRDYMMMAANWQREQMAKSGVDKFMARDRSGDLHVFGEKPDRTEDDIWDCDSEDLFRLPYQMFPDLKWEDEPRRVKVVII